MSMIQFNLLPSVKAEYIKTQKTKRLLISLATITASISLALFVIMFLTANVVQKKQLSDAAKDVSVYTEQLKSKPNVDNIVTVQNQLKSIVPLHQQKKIASRVFKYLPALTPTNVSISKITIDFINNAVEITGISDSQQTINTFIDTLKFTTFKSSDNDNTTLNAFSDVVETSFTISQEGTSADFTITAAFDPALFGNQVAGQTPKLTVPQLTSTRSVLSDPASKLFNGTIKPKTNEKNQDSN